MGKISTDKKLYDELTYKYFISQDWRPVIITRPGKRLPDLIAFKYSKELNQMAIIEVKTPKERSASIKWDDTKDISTFTDKNLVKYLRTARSEIASLFSSRKESLAKFYGIVIMCQLFRYTLDAKIIAKYRGEEIAWNFENYHQFIPFLVIPIENSDALTTALTRLIEHEYIKNYSLDRSDNYKLCTVQVTYNFEKLSGS